MKIVWSMLLGFFMGMFDVCLKDKIPDTLSRLALKLVVAILITETFLLIKYLIRQKSANLESSEENNSTNLP